MSYVDGFALAVPTANKAAFLNMPAWAMPSSSNTAHCAWWSAGAMMSSMDN